VADYLIGAPQSVAVALYAVSYLFGGTFATIAAVTDLFRRQVNVDLLMVTAAIGAAIVGHWEEGAILLGLFSSSNALEHHALGRTRRAVRSLMALSPDEATLYRPDLPGGELVVPIEELRLGDVVLVRPGERVAVDGVVESGQTAIDQAAITGESIPVEKGPGDQVFAATINTTGAIRVTVTKLASESTLARIVQIVDDAQEQKSKTQRFTDAFEGKYTVAVIVGSVLAFLGFWQLGGATSNDAFYRAITLLVVASPCALVISTPASTLSGLANAARNGILFKGSGYLEDLGSIETIGFDKTGTLTVGHPRLTDVVSLDNGWSEEELFRLAASAEYLSEHHLGVAMVEAAVDRGVPLSEPEAFRAIPGQGIVARVDGRDVAIGNQMLFSELGIDTRRAQEIAATLREQGKSAVLVGDRTAVRGVIAVADMLRPHAAEVIEELRQLGVKRTLMLTGDHETVARAIGREVGIDEVYADLLPEEKLETIRRLELEGQVAMVGDGVNDAPALATATVGVAMGGAGTDVALETADVVLISDDLTRLPYAVSLSRRTRRTILQNLAFSLTVIVVLVISALTIGIPLPLGVIGHEGSTVIVVLNGLRLLRR
jgi:Zn2+/Cd2+-exporting ATPase